jgi:hypothetical protein
MCIQYLSTDYMITYKHCSIQDIYLIHDTFITFSSPVKLLDDRSGTMYCTYGRYQIKKLSINLVERASYCYARAARIFQYRIHDWLD